MVAVAVSEAQYTIATSRLSTFELRIEEIVEDVRHEGIHRACARHGVQLTGAGMPDRRNAIGKVLYERIQELERDPSG